MTTARQAAAQRDMALIVAAVAGAPGAQHRGAEFWVTVARNVCARHGCRTLGDSKDQPPDPVTHAPPLTVIDAQRLSLLAEGLTLQEVADRTCYGHDAIKSAFKRTYRALGARNAAHAVALALRAGLID